MKTRIILPALAIAALAFTGCSSNSERAADPAPEAIQEAAATPTVETATVQQVASVIAEYEPDWREVMDSLDDCDTTWMTAELAEGDEAFLAGLDGITCSGRIDTMTITAGTAVTRLDKLVIPAELEDLVSETRGQLSSIADSEYHDVCGVFSVPADEPGCPDALDTMRMRFIMLDGTLNAWSPYL